MGYSFSTLRDIPTLTNRKTAVITFDDGYQDILQALPILEKYQAPATVFVITEDVGKRAVVWEEAGEKLPADILSWESLIELRRTGWEIGSHSGRHVHLTRYAEAEQFELVAGSIRTLEERVGHRPVSFAYPYNDHDATTRAVVASLGFKYAVTTNASQRNECHVLRNRLELSRVSLGGSLSVHYFKCLIRLMRACGPLTVVAGLLNLPAKLALLRMWQEAGMRKIGPLKDQLLSRRVGLRLSATDEDIVARVEGAEGKQSASLLSR